MGIMRGADIMKPVITKISPKQAADIIDKRKPRGLFYMLENGRYIGIDNSTGDAWVEEFSNLRNCKRWLVYPSMTLD